MQVPEQMLRVLDLVLGGGGAGVSVGPIQPWPNSIPLSQPVGPGEFDTPALDGGELMPSVTAACINQARLCY